MISEELRARIRRLFFAEHWKIGTIATELGVHRDTVALAVETTRFATARFQSKAMLLDPYRDFVRNTLEQYPRLRSTRLLEMIQARVGARSASSAFETPSVHSPASSSSFRGLAPHSLASRSIRPSRAFSAATSRRSRASAAPRGPSSTTT